MVNNQRSKLQVSKFRDAVTRYTWVIALLGKAIKILSRIWPPK